MGADFPFSAKLALRSVRRADPDADIDLHLLGKVPTSPHFESLADEIGVTVCHIDLDDLTSPWPGIRGVFAGIPTGAASARSNLLRYLLLHRHGGVYIDLDVVVRRPLHGLAGGADFVGVEHVWQFDRARVEGHWNATMLPATVGWAVLWWLCRVDSQLTGGRLRFAARLAAPGRRFTVAQPNNAVIGARRGSPFIAELLYRARNVDPRVRYALGPSLLADTVAARPDLVTVLPEDVLYPVPPGQSFRFFEDITMVLPETTALIHYVQSNHAELLRTLGPGDPRWATEAGVFWRLGAAALRSSINVEVIAA